LGVKSGGNEQGNKQDCGGFGHRKMCLESSRKE
jgi:hypothetical protein